MRANARLLAVLTALVGANGCVASEAPDMPPPIDAPREAGVLDAPPPPDAMGPCPGHGMVTAAFDRGSAVATCWSGRSALMVQGGVVPPGQPATTLSGTPQSYPGLYVAILLYSGSVHGHVCSPGPGSMIALDSPCVFVTATYLGASTDTEWRAFAGAAANPFTGDASPAAAHGSLLLTSYDPQVGGAVSASFAAGSSLVLDAPGHPPVAIAGSVSVSLQ